MKRVIITGASGFIGSYLMEHLKGYELIPLSLRTPDWKEQLFEADVVIHCAGLAHSSKKLSSMEYHQANCELTKELIEVAERSAVQHFIYLSTMLVYGEGHIGKVDGSTSLNPINDYAISKRCAEEVVESSKLATTILRLPLVLGEKGKGNLALLARLASFSPLFLNIPNRRSILTISDLNILMNQIIQTTKPGILHPVSDNLSTSELYQRLRKGKSTLYLPILKGIMSILRGHSFFSKVFGDAYYSDDIALRNN